MTQTTETLPDAVPNTNDQGAAEMERLAKQRRFYEKLMALSGKVHLDIDLDELRGRNRR